jgi:hypothetical protein
MDEERVGWRGPLLVVLLAALAVGAFFAYVTLLLDGGLSDTSTANVVTVIAAGSFIGAVLGGVLLVVWNAILALYLSARDAKRERRG